jgi:hypothetical protein
MLQATKQQQNGCNMALLPAVLALMVPQAGTQADRHCAGQMQPDKQLKICIAAPAATAPSPTIEAGCCPLALNLSTMDPGRTPMYEGQAPHHLEVYTGEQ